jgi:hypothetical protein
MSARNKTNLIGFVASNVMKIQDSPSMIIFQIRVPVPGKTKSDHFTLVAFNKIADLIYDNAETNVTEISAWGRLEQTQDKFSSDKIQLVVEEFSFVGRKCEK